MLRTVLNDELWEQLRAILKATGCHRWKNDRQVMEAILWGDYPLGVNPGRSKAEEAAKLVSGEMITLVFAPGEQTSPEGLERITKEAFLWNSLTTVQQETYQRVKQYTDFNDLTTKSVLGKEGVKGKWCCLLIVLCKTMIRCGHKS